MRAVNAETTTQVPDIQNKGPLYSLGTTLIKLQKLCNHLRGYKDSYFLWHRFSYGFKLQYMGPRLPRRSDNLPSLHVNPQIAKTKIQKEVFLKRGGWPL